MAAAKVQYCHRHVSKDIAACFTTWYRPDVHHNSMPLLDAIAFLQLGESRFCADDETVGSSLKFPFHSVMVFVVRFHAFAGSCEPSNFLPLPSCRLVPTPCLGVCLITWRGRATQRSSAQHFKHRLQQQFQLSHPLRERHHGMGRMMKGRWTSSLRGGTCGHVPLAVGPDLGGENAFIGSERQWEGSADRMETSDW